MKVFSKTRGGWRAALAALALVTAAACSGGAHAAGDNGAEAAGDNDAISAVGEGSFVGRVDGSGALLALVADGAQVAGYVCEGDQVSAWLRSGETDGDGVALVGRDGQPRGTVSFAGDSASGEVTIDGATHTFTLASAAGDAGLYRGFADLGADGTQVGGVTTKAADGSGSSTAPRRRSSRTSWPTCSSAAPRARA